MFSYKKYSFLLGYVNFWAQLGLIWFDFFATSFSVSVWKKHTNKATNQSKPMEGQLVEASALTPPPQTANPPSVISSQRCCSVRLSAPAASSSLRARHLHRRGRVSRPPLTNTTPRRLLSVQQTASQTGPPCKQTCWSPELQSLVRIWASWL